MNRLWVYSSLLLMLLPLQAQRDIYAPQLRLQIEGEDNVIVWDTTKTGFELSRSTDLLTWLPQGPAVVAGGKQTWTLPQVGPKEFFRIDPISAPPVPQGLTATVRGDRVYLHWLDVPTAENYVVLVGKSLPVNLGNFDFMLENLQSNEVEVTGLTLGETYHFAVIAANRKGSSAVTDPVTRALVETTTITSRVIVSCPVAGADPFTVGLSGMSVVLEKMPEKTLVKEVLSGRHGRVQLSDVPYGTYRLGVLNGNGWLGTYGANFTIGRGGLVHPDLVVGSGSSTTGIVVGNVTDSDGRPVLLDHFDTNYTHQVTVSVRDHSNAVIASSVLNGTHVFAFNNIPSSAYPISVQANFKSLNHSITLNSIAEKGPVHLVLTNDPPYFSGVYVSRNPSPDAIREVRCGDVLTGHALVKSASAKPYSVRWVVEFPAGNVLYDTTLAEPQFAFTQTTSGVIHFRVVVESDGLPVTSEFSLPYDCSGNTCLSGAVVVWDPALPRYQTPIATAAVSVKSSAPGSVTETVVCDAQGAFDFAAIAPLTRPVLQISKPGYIPWSWRFDDTPIESTYAMVPTSTISTAVDNASALTISLPGNHRLILPPDSLRRGLGDIHSGGVRIEVGTWDPRATFTPFPFLATQDTFDIHLLTGIWINITDVLGIPLIPQDGGFGLPKLQHAPAASVFAPGGMLGENTGTPIAVVKRNDTLGTFEPMGTANQIVDDAIRYEQDLTTNAGLFALRLVTSTTRLLLPTDKTIVYPFTILLGNSAFPVHVYSDSSTSMGPLKIDFNKEQQIKVLHLRQSPGDYYDDYVSPNPLPVAPYAKTVIQQRVIAAAEATATRAPIMLGLSAPIAALRNSPGESNVPVSSIDHDHAFFAPYDSYRTTSVVAGESIGQTYYRLIAAPTTLAQWRQGNALNPVNPSLPPLNPSVGDWTVAYYYNQADLGFSRRLSLRTIPGNDNQPNVAMEVTNFKTIEDARCNKAPLASVCMEYSSKGDVTQARYVKFYTYGGDGQLLDRVSLDGRAPKMMPNLCVVCHGGTTFGESQNPNLGASFLPFDMESFTTLRIHGQQKDRIAKLNKAVLQTSPSAAIVDLIHGWYGNSDPMVNPFAYNPDYISQYVPPGSSATSFQAGGSTAHDFYLGVFRNDCRICHISRPGGLNFETWTGMQLMLSPARSAANRMHMPAAPRTYGIFWGNHAAHLLNPSVPDHPAQLYAPDPIPPLLPPTR